MLLSACGAPSAIKPVEYLDDRTAMTVGSLKEPIEFVPSLRQEGLHVIGQPRQALELRLYRSGGMGRSGSIVYGLWVHIAPGNDRPIRRHSLERGRHSYLDNGARV